jgi:hypothetical protein
MDLAGSFSHEERLEFFRERFRPGVVLKLFCDFTVPPKEKRLIVVSVEPEPLLLVINSEINEYKQKRPHLRGQQIAISSEECDFLDHDSFIDCSKVYDDFSSVEIENVVVNDTTLILGNINSRIVGEIMTVVDDSVTLEQRHKTRIISDLNP